MKFGINCWSFPKTFPIEEALKAAKEIGYDGYEVGLALEDLEHFGKDEFKTKFKTIKETSESIDIEIPSVATGLFWRFNPITDKENALKVVKAECEAASLLGAELILVVPGVGVPSLAYEKHFEKASDFVKKASKIAEECGVKIGLENVWNRVFAGPLEFKQLLDEINCENVGAYFDVGNTIPHSLPEHWIRVLKDKILQVHVKDFNLVELKFGIPLSGSVNWSEVRKALEEVKYDGYILPEVPPYLADPVKAAEDSFTSLKKIFG
ncbi:sugar phosphate isomerase/epimerase family protein [Thermococcus paralvinellae]|uniref:Xylose isomerase-like protein n=1 Tax=Thermococcus paralvinellae TaxID=582419 RepID=W0I6C1_9EURY|nr:sugar phosphate isomerase/epimerase family protein [Thermococcus paralvinellae]AHF79928.1 Xylose isomerase-like protein [Thermococcus paralvinellae]